MSDNPLIAEEKHDSSPYAGIGILDSAAGCGEALNNGEWIDAGIDAVSAGVGYVNYLHNPAGALLGWGVDWLFEHVEALSEPLDWLASKSRCDHRACTDLGQYRRCGHRREARLRACGG